jgi:predicted acylesterase/phospholipase RssA
MKEFSWGLRYLLLLFKKSYLLVFMLFLQGFATIGVVQGREMLSVMNSEDGYQLANLAFGFASIFSGILYFFGVYWLLFFSTIKATLYDLPENYPDFTLKIRAADYHDFMDQYRIRLISFYTSALLFGPFFIQLAALLFADGMGTPLAIITFITVFANCLILFWKANRNGSFISAITRILIGIDALIFRILSVLKKAYRFFLPGRKPEQIPASYSTLPLTTEGKVHSILQAHPMHRAGFFLLLFIAFSGWFGLLWMPDSWIQELGALVCLQMGLCFWVVVVVVLEFINKRVAFPVRLGLLAWLLFCSWSNSDYPVRVSPVRQAFEVASEPQVLFDHWLSSRLGFQDSVSRGFIQVGGKKYCAEQPFPVWIICAEGGASRSGYWTAAMLDFLRKKEGESFDRHLFAISSVSGGSMGSIVYSAGRTQLNADSLSKPISDFFSTDFLAPLTNRLVSGGPVGWMSPAYLPFFDRAITFESIINQALIQKMKMGEIPVFQGWSPLSGEYSPLLILNSVEAETGRRSILANQPISFPHNNEVVNLNDLLENRGLDLAGAIHISARFPVFSPSGALTDKYCKTHHFVDGGYYDNVGYETATDLIESIQKSSFAPYIRPVVVSLINSYENAESIVESAQIKPNENQSPSFRPDFGQHFLNEPMSIVASVAHIRAANTERHWKDLLGRLELPKDQSQPVSRFYTFDLKASQKEIPLNWRISKRAQMTLLDRVNRVDNQLKWHPELKKPISLGLDVSCENSVSRPASQMANQSVQPTPKVGIQNPDSQISKVKTSPATHPGLYYFSLKRQKWVLKSEADFPKSKIRKLSKGFSQKKKAK